MQDWLIPALAALAVAAGAFVLFSIDWKSLYRRIFAPPDPEASRAAWQDLKAKFNELPPMGKAIAFLPVAILLAVTADILKPSDKPTNHIRCPASAVGAMQDYVRALGYTCHTVSHCSPSSFSRSIRITCSPQYYTYSFTDHGGKWLLDPVD